MTRFKGVEVGTVVDLNDPNGEGRIRVNFPWMGGENELFWAPVATLMTGGGRGSWFMPEVGDEVLVAFEQEDVEHPFVMGFLWNGKDKPPESSSHKRLLKSVKGHTILLDDTDGSEKIEITTGKGLKITMDDISNSITIQASDSITVKATNQVAVQAPTVKVDAEKIQLGGDAAIHNAVWGEVLYDYLQTLYGTIVAHQHIGELALGIFPVTPMVGVPPPPPVPPEIAILSQVVTEA